MIYLEDQYLWSAEIVTSFAQALAAQPQLHMIAVLPAFPDQDGKLSGPMSLLGRIQALDLLHRAGGERFAAYSLENHSGTPVYVHAKACVIDDIWASVGSDNVNRRSWTHDSELSCAVLDDRLDPREPRDPAGLGDGARTYARNLRLRLNREHLDQDPPADLAAADPLCDPAIAFDAFATTAAMLDQWHRAGRQGPRPPGRLRRYATPQLSPLATIMAAVPARLVADPDGRPRAMRRQNTY